MNDPVLDHALSRQPKLIDDLKALVACPSVGADPAMAQGMEDARLLIEARLDAMGFVNRRRLTPVDGSGQPTLYGERLDARSAPTILIYAHYDVQPSDPLDKWNTPPFEATEHNGRLYGRGISDDKGPMMIALDTLAAFVDVDGRLPINVKLLIEGEEETGSPSLPGILEAHRGLLVADAVLSADGARWRSDLVALNVGSRGNAGFEMRVQTASQDLHSGRFGGIVANPLHVLSKLIASLHDEHGYIAAPGFYDDVAEPTNAERAEIAEIPYDEDTAFAAISAQPVGEKGFSTLERLWMRPSVDVNGMWGGYTGAGSKTVIPNEAFAKLTMRLVPGQVPQTAKEAVIAHLRAALPPYASLEIYGDRGQGGAYAVPDDHPLLGAAVAALKHTTNESPLKVRIGASLPLTEIVSRVLGLDTVMFSFALSDERFHAPNEFFRLSSISDGLEAWVQIIREIALIPTGKLRTLPTEVNGQPIIDNRFGAVLLIAAAAVFTADVSVLRFVSSDVPFAQIVFYRSLCQLIIVAIWIAATRPMRFLSSRWPLLVIRGPLAWCVGGCITPAFKCWTLHWLPSLRLPRLFSLLCSLHLFSANIFLFRVA